MATCSEYGTHVGRFGLTDGKYIDCHSNAVWVNSLEETELDAAHNLPVTARLGIVIAECVIGMDLLKNAAALFRDAFKGRRKTMQQGLRDAWYMALDELKDEALGLGADALVGVDLDYSEINGAGKSRLFLFASGTAVKLDLAQ